ncbi:hypothetical protein BBBOND_0313780 [Babesia bigemina]|uniref:Uncharacterized protein n=1 Tax=Babesia bigemina TaxID=5866 RepID=A0A061D9U6_BABBI|nr:hypothetical protein BBBOND_0313780 [Babesia bigemina]CDR97476.1 hypothetical protein BBBOND_0313780 [Babesia bigemina]|eukprot:XP_012769662.1 hypothetical protein BBBOND_0313780 [Babesia bigemina]
MQSQEKAYNDYANSFDGYPIEESRGEKHIMYDGGVHPDVGGYVVPYKCEVNESEMKESELHNTLLRKRQELHEKHNSEDEKLKKTLEEGEQRRKDAEEWANKIDDILQREKSQVDMVQSMGDVLGEVEYIQPIPKTYVPLGWIGNYVSRIPKPIPPVIETFPHEYNPVNPTHNESNVTTNLSDTTSLPEIDLSIKVFNPVPSQTFNDYDYKQSIPKQAAPKVADLDDFSLKDADRAAINIPMAVFPDQSPDDINEYVCQNPWYVSPFSTSVTSPPTTPVPVTDHLPTPQTVREMLYWFVGLNQYGLIGKIKDYVESILVECNRDAIEVTGDSDQLTASMVTDKLTETCLYSATVIYKIKYKDISDVFKDFFNDPDKYAFYYSSETAGLLCQLRDYVYACHYQLQFLKAQCERDKLSGGWRDCHYGSDITASEYPLQAFLTDGWDSDFETHLFDPCNLCHKSRVRMEFKKVDLPMISQLGSVISTILSPSCGGEEHGALVNTVL